MPIKVRSSIVAILGSLVVAFVAQILLAAVLAVFRSPLNHSAWVADHLPAITALAYENAKLAAEAAMAEAKSHGWAMAIAIVDPSGLLVYFEKMTNTQNASGDLAIEKARTSALFRRSTRVFQDALAAGGDNLRVLGLTGVIPNAGGIPIVVAGRIIGGELSNGSSPFAGMLLILISSASGQIRRFGARSSQRDSRRTRDARVTTWMNYY